MRADCGSVNTFAIFDPVQRAIADYLGHPAEQHKCNLTAVSGARHQEEMIANDSIDFQDVQVDAHLPDVLIFPAGTDLHDHPMVLAGQLILQVEPCFAPACLLLTRILVAFITTERGLPSTECHYLLKHCNSAFFYSCCSSSMPYTELAGV